MRLWVPQAASPRLFALQAGAQKSINKSSRFATNNQDSRSFLLGTKKDAIFSDLMK